MLHGCTIGRGALIGIGTKVLNGARIGEGALVGAHSIVGEGKVIPPNALAVGSPAKVIRELTDKDRERIAAGVTDYMSRWRLYSAKLTLQSEG